MGTRCLIGTENKDHTITMVYCHWDGYPEHTGDRLLNHYNSKNKIQDLIDKGSFSFLEENIDDISFYTDTQGIEKEIYHFKSLDELNQKLHEMWDIEWFYLYDLTHDEPQWFAAENKDDALFWQTLRLLV